MRLQPGSLAFVVALSCLGRLSVSAQDRSPSAAAAPASFWQAAGGVATVNWLTWAYNWYLQRWRWSNVGLESWGHNLRRGFAWDNDCFVDNQLAHPYHGSFYHNSARASGYGFWGSLPFVAVGSATWELFGENIRASLNDLINTTLGGAALGEVTYRLSAMLGSSRSSSARNRFGRELGAFAMSPVARVHGLLHRRGDGLTDPLDPSAAEPAVVAIGRHSGHAFVELAVQYGSPFDPGVVRPYDAFEFRLQLSPDASGLIHHVGVSGLLARRSLRHSTSGHLILGLFQHYDYDDLSGLKSSGQSLSAALMYQRRLGGRNRVNLSAQAEGILLGGISSDHGFTWRRDYDLGPGAGGRAGAAWVRDGREWLRIDGRIFWLHSLHGSDATHRVSFLRLGGSVPLVARVGLGGEAAVTVRHSTYQNFPAATQRVPYLRVYLTWVPS